VCHRAAEYLRYHDVTAHPIPIHSQDPPSQIILDEALGRKVSFVAMGAYGHAGIAEWLFGSTTKHILHRAPLPLFLYH
jgi:nucleotide-binding universal stress UspA family protein